MSDEKVQLRRPDGKPGPRIDKNRYTVIRAILLDIIPNNPTGVPFVGLADKVSKALPHTPSIDSGSVGWLTTHIKLDLEARGEIERVPDSSPQRLRRT